MFLGITMWFERKVKPNFCSTKNTLEKCEANWLVKSTSLNTLHATSYP